MMARTPTTGIFIIFPPRKGDNGWYSKNPRWQQEWYGEIKELVDNYHPDLLYSDGGVPFANEVGLSQIASLYNDSLAHTTAAVRPSIIASKLSAGRWVQDYERGVGGGIDPYPWQTDTSIGDWFYNKHYKDKQTGTMYSRQNGWRARSWTSSVKTAIFC